MKLKKILLITIIILSILTMTCVSASQNITADDADIDEQDIVSEIDTEPNITVPSKIWKYGENESTIDTNEEYLKSFDYVQKAIDDAEENDTIELSGTYYGNGRHISLEKSLTFQGRENATFDAQKLSRIFLITSSDVVFKNINFINGNFNDTTNYFDGGIIKSDWESTMTFINCSFLNNTVLGEGTIFTEGETSIVNSTFINNTAEGYGGAIFSEGAAISIDNSTFISNSASNGGAIEIDMSSLFISNSKFISNCASSGSGGAVSSNGFVFVTNSSFLKNHASASGGAIKIDSCLEAINSTFTENTAGIGGAIYLSCFEVGPNLSITNSTFLKNSAKDMGGALYFSFSVYMEHQTTMPDGNANLKGDNFENNTAEMAGAIFIYGNLNISDSVFENNFADSIGSIQIASSSTVNVSDCSFKNNSNRNIRFSGQGKLIIGDAEYTQKTILDNELPTIKVNVAKIDTYYNSGKLLTIKLTDFKSKKPVPGYVSLKVGKKTYELKTNTKGIATFTASTLNVGKYSLTVTHKTGDKYLAIADTFSTINIRKASTTVKAPKVVNKYKKSKYFNVNIKSNKKAVKNLKIKVKVYTGKKYKTYTIKTDKKGIAKLNTKSLKIGKHKAVVSSGNNNYKVSAKSQITIKR